jgi:hypothetical protein
VYSRRPALDEHSPRSGVVVRSGKTYYPKMLLSTEVWALGAAGAFGALLTEAAEVSLFIRRYSHIPGVAKKG